ncbi:MAG: DUF1822 family protein [Phormidesmis sp.]
MIITRSQQMGITLPITREFQQMAQRFAQMCPFAEKAEQIRHNTLAVCAVNAYLQLMEIPTAIAQADSWNPMMQMLSNVADLPLPGVGILSCRVADVEADVCIIPPEAWSERIGYVAVAIDEAAHEATLIGFTPSARESEQLTLAQFLPIEALVDRVHALQSAIAADSPEAIAAGQSTNPSTLTQIGRWIEGAIDTMSDGWQTVESLVNPVEPNFAFRTADLAESAMATDASRAKLVNLGLQLDEAVRVALVIHITEQRLTEQRLTEQPSDAIAPNAATRDTTEPAPNRSNSDRSNIVLQVRPLGDSPYLEENLTMTVLDEQAVPFMSVTSREIDNYIQLRLSGQVGEHFGVTLSMGETVFEEWFVI